MKLPLSLLTRLTAFVELRLEHAAILNGQLLQPDHLLESMK